MRELQRQEGEPPAKRQKLEAAESLAPGPVSLTAGPSHQPPPAAVITQPQPITTTAISGATEKVTQGIITCELCFVSFGVVFFRLLAYMQCMFVCFFVV